VRVHHGRSIGPFNSSAFHQLGAHCIHVIHLDGELKTRSDLTTSHRCRLDELVCSRGFSRPDDLNITDESL
jgi:hypothetical protein